MSRESVIKSIQEKQIQLLSAEYVDFGGISRSKAATLRDLDSFLEHGVVFAKGNFGTNCVRLVAAEAGYTPASDEANLIPDIETFAVAPYADQNGPIYG